MLVPIKWLQDFIEISLPPDEIAKVLVSIGFEVENIINLSENLTNVRTCKIIESSPHPKSKDLLVYKVDLNTNVIQVISSCFDLKVNDIVAVALDGGKINNKPTIKNTSVMGELSQGLFCGKIDLNLKESLHEEDLKDEIHIFLPNTPIGIDVNSVLGNDDFVLDISITSNRPDANSILGIARELAAALNLKLKPLNLEKLFFVGTLPDKTVDIINEEPEKCKIYLSFIIENIKILDSTPIIKNRLRAVGLRPINNIVDLTNYILIAVGQPMHAFDYDLIRGKKIIIRNAKKDEFLAALDNNEYKLSTDDLVIANEQDAMAIAGVIGSKDFSINPQTTTVLLESALFTKETVRKTAKRLGIRTDSSAKFEKGVDFQTQSMGIQLFKKFIVENKWGNSSNQFTGYQIDAVPNKTISFSKKQIENILGIPLEQKHITDCLISLNFDIKTKEDLFFVTAPLFRFDIESPNDIAEEVIRMLGYDKLPTSKTTKFTLTSGLKDEHYVNLDKIKQVLIINNFYETMTYSFISPKDIEFLNLESDHEFYNYIKLHNPLGYDLSIMRTTLIPSLLKVIAKNFARSTRKGRLFEISNTYFKKGNEAKEIETLALASYNFDDFYSFKNTIEDIFDRINLKVEFEENKTSYLHPYISANIIVNSNVVGVIGKINKDITNNFNLPENVYISELNLTKILNLYKGFDKFQPISRYQPVERDFAIICKKSIKAQEILDEVKSAAQSHLKSTFIFDVYESKLLGNDVKSIAFKIILQRDDKSFTEQEINSISDNIISKLQEKFDIKLR